MVKKQFGKMNLICDDDDRITRTLNSFDISLIHVKNICDTFRDETLKGKAMSSTITSKESFIKTTKKSCSKVTLHFGPGLNLPWVLNSVSGD